ncbi:hypothetical protein INR49_015153 [Caranx melampygus]|nr:hypothetical protein INR49_015153 [Caranx melampygus]
MREGAQTQDNQLRTESRALGKPQDNVTNKKTTTNRPTLASSKPPPPADIPRLLTGNLAQEVYCCSGMAMEMEERGHSPCSPSLCSFTIGWLLCLSSSSLPPSIHPFLPISIAAA